MPPTRRERLRAQTLGEIREHAVRQVTEGGPAALSLNAIAKAMGMSGPALYRYFASRDELLADLVVAGYAELADAVGAAVAGAGDDPATRLHAAAAGYRAWALAHPQRFSLLFGLRPPGFADPDAAIAAIQGAMDLLLAELRRLAPGAAGEPDPELAAWAARRGIPETPAALLRAGVALWTRMHGLVTLELSGAMGDMGLDVERLLANEVDAALAALPVG